MTASTYMTAMGHIRRDEGGYVNHPKDPGGATNFGVTQAVYDAYRKRLGLAVRSVRSITEAEVAAIYQTQYADKVRYNDLPAGVDYATLDAAVNSGVSRGAKWLQLSIGTTADGVIGSTTVSKANASGSDPVKIVKAICSKRLSFVQGLRTWGTFGKGWGRRIAGVEANGVKMALSARPNASASAVKATLQAEVEVAAQNSISQRNLAGSTALPATAAGGAAVTDLNNATVVALAVAAVVLVGVIVFLVRKSSINKLRADAYAAAALET